MILIGTRSSLVVEYEETCKRCALAVEAAISFHPSPRLLDPTKAVCATKFDAAQAASGFIPCAFVPDARKAYFERARAMGLTPSDPLIDPFAAVASSAMVGAASFVNAGAVIGALSVIGQAVLINRNASVGHHCILEDFVSVAPGATLASNIRVGEGSVIAAGATVLPNVRVGAGAVIAAGVVVRSDVGEGRLVSGFPAKQRRFDRKRSSLFAEDEE